MLLGLRCLLLRAASSLISMYGKDFEERRVLRDQKRNLLWMTSYSAKILDPLLIVLALCTYRKNSLYFTAIYRNNRRILMCLRSNLIKPHFPSSSYTSINI